MDIEEITTKKLFEMAESGREDLNKDYTNEQLVEMIQASRDELFLDLWLRVWRFVWQKATSRYYAFWGSGYDGACSAGGVFEDDLFQSGYLALVDAVATFDNSRGNKFTTWLDFYLKREFDAAQGRRTSRRDPIDKSMSYDRPSILGDDESEPLSDFIPSERKDILTIEERVFLEQLREAIETALDKLPEREAYAIRRSYFDGKTYRNIGEAVGVSTDRVRQIIKRGISTLRNQRAKNRLEEFLRERTNYYKGVGARTYYETGQSSTERLALRRVELEEKLSEDNP